MEKHVNHLIQLIGWLENILESRARACIAFYQQRRALAALQSFGDRELKDIGIYRGQIESAVKGRLPDAAMTAQRSSEDAMGGQQLAA